MASLLQTEHPYHQRGIFEVEPQPWILPPELPKHTRTEEELRWLFTHPTTSITLKLEEELNSSEIIRNSVFLSREKNIQLLERLYTFSNPIEVKEFLLMHRDLIRILFEAPDHIHRIFGQVPIHLELHRDPEEGWDELFIVIRSPCATEEAIRRENQLVEEWFLKRMDYTRGRLNITEEPL